ncbi:hypothetical protein ACFYQ5_03780 [Streptomyces sp. NPDC005794]|uniref:hypothetical protein n=1 Tax=Streptomyces sp. NPDC005794 TaxID=3364733 RepID=UPI0036757C1B
MSMGIASLTKSPALMSADTARTTAAFIEKNTSTGKMTRASLMMAATVGIWIRPDDVRVQAAVKPPHNAALHDDMADSDDLGRGRPRGGHSA